MFEVISDIWHIGLKCEMELFLQFVSALEKDYLCIMLIKSKQYGIKCLSNILQSEQCNVIFKVISEIMAHWYEMWIQFFLQLVSAQERKWFVHWCWS